MSSTNTFELEDKYMVPFFVKQPISIEKGDGVYVWDEDGNKYLDFTSGWGVTCIGHGSKVIQDALYEQSGKVIQNPNSGLTYSPPRAKLLSLMGDILPQHLTRIFFSNSGAEANDAVIKLARKVTGRMDVLSMEKSFHGRTISTASATGQATHRDKFNPLMPNYRFIPFGDIDALKEMLKDNVAAIILEPIQGEGGVRIPTADYLSELDRLCKANGTLIIMDEIQTGFCRTGTMFASDDQPVKADMITMAKGIAGGFPFGAFAITEDISQKIEIGDHGGTYCGNPLGCAVSYAVIKHLVDNKIADHVQELGEYALTTMNNWKEAFPEAIADVRGKGLLILLDLKSVKLATAVCDACMEKGLFVRQTQLTGIRIFPALTITKAELDEGLAILEKAIKNAQ